MKRKSSDNIIKFKKVIDFYTFFIKSICDSLAIFFNMEITRCLFNVEITYSSEKL